LFFATIQRHTAAGARNVSDVARQAGTPTCASVDRVHRWCWILAGARMWIEALDGRFVDATFKVTFVTWDTSTIDGRKHKARRALAAEPLLAVRVQAFWRIGEFASYWTNVRT